jgi:hypothetical protein
MEALIGSVGAYWKASLCEGCSGRPMRHRDVTNLAEIMAERPHSALRLCEPHRSPSAGVRSIGR